MLATTDPTLHPAYRQRAGDGAIFTSSKCPSGPGLKHSCELPFGMVWTPMSIADGKAVVNDIPPILCLKCLSYMSLYANFDAATHVWTCPLCGADNVAPKQMFDGTANELSSIVVSPMVEYRQTIATTQKDAINIVLLLDGNLDAVEANAIGNAIQDTVKAFDTTQDLRLGLVIFDESVRVYQLGLTGMASADVIVPPADEETDLELITRRTKIEHGAYLSNDPTLTTFWFCMAAIYGGDAKENGTPQTPISRKEMLKRKKVSRQRGIANPNKAESPWLVASSSTKSRCTGEALQAAMDLANFGAPARTSRLLLFTNGCPNMGAGSLVRPEKPDVVNPHEMRLAIPYFSLIGKDALETGIGIDVFCGGVHALGMPAFQALVNPSGGYALPHQSFHEGTQFHVNVAHILAQTHMSRMVDTDALLNQLSECLVDLRMSSFVHPTHVVGATEILYDEAHALLPNERSAFAVGASLAAKQGMTTYNLPSDETLESTLTRLRMGRYDPLSTLSVMLQVNEDVVLETDKYALFQCTVRYVENNGTTLVTRVSTHRLPVARSVHDFLNGMDENAVPIVLGKECVFRAVVGREQPEGEESMMVDPDRMEVLAYEAQRDLDNTVHRISGAFRIIGLEEGTSGRRESFADEEEGVAPVSVASSALDFAFPPELADALHRLFHLRRGSMVSPGPMGSFDDRAEIRSLFLRLPLEDCLCMMAPSLWSSKVDGTTGLEAVPSDTLALWDNRIIAADHHDSLFVWSGRGTVGPEYDATRQHCKEFLLARSKTRFPSPSLHMLTEGDSMSRRFTTRLAPSHADPHEQQLVHFPALASLSPTEMQDLRGKFRFYDASTDASFRRWFWGVASASSNARNEGMSLCQ
jgi:Sec23/Sec24 trunk domain/Sec23/Sec24 zinc finger